MIGAVGSKVKEVLDAMVGRVWSQPHIEFNVGISSKNSKVGYSFVFGKTEKVFTDIRLAGCIIAIHHS